MAGETAIALDGATKHFDGRSVVEDLTFTIDRGRIFGLIGPSGCGKTTTVRMVTGVHAPSVGRVVVLGREPRAFRARDRERIGYMPQHFVLYPELSVWENLDFVASLYGVSIFGRSKRLAELLDFVELSDARDTQAGQVSGGMQRRLVLACTLVHQPDLIVFDEPTAGVDPILRQKFWGHFRELRDAGRTLLITTQYVTEAAYCDDVAAMQDGRLVAIGSPDEVRRQAMGGDAVELTSELLTPQVLAQLKGIDGVRRIDWVAPDRVRIMVEDAGTVMPRLVAGLQEAGLPVESMSEHHPTFDEVFVRLMEQRDSPPATEADDSKLERAA